MTVLLNAKGETTTIAPQGQGDPRVKKIKRIFDSMKSSRQNWESHWKELFFYMLPRKEDVHTWKNLSKGEDKHDKLYDSSAVHYAELLASALHSMMTNPVTQWFSLGYGDPAIDDDVNVQAYLQKLVRKIHQLINNSNFHSQVHEVYLDLAVPGTGVLRVDEDDDNVFNFLSKPIYQVYVKESIAGIVDTLATEDIMSVRQAFAKYGMEKFGDGQKITDLKKDLDKEISILHIVMPKADMDLNILGSTKFEYASFHVWLDGEMLLKEGGFNEFPYMVPRWAKISGESYGRGPGDKALPDVKMLNSMAKTTIRGAQKVVDPTLLVDNDGVMGRVNTRPGGLIAVRGGTKDKISPLLTGGEPQVGMEMQESTRARIKEHFFIDQLQLRMGPQMTATESTIRDSDRIRLFSPVIGRFHFEFLQQLIARLLGIMIRKKELPEGIPKAIQGKVPKVFFTSALAQAQKVAESENIGRFMESLAPIFQAAPQEVTALFNVKRFVYFNGRQFNVAQEIFNTPDELKETQEAMAQQQEQERQNSQALTDAEVINKTGAEIGG